MKKCLYFLLVFYFNPLCLLSQWHEVNTNTNLEIVDLYFRDENLGYAICQNTVLRSNDGGENWETLFTSPNLYMNLSIVCTNDSVFCFATTFQGAHQRIQFSHNNPGAYSIYPKLYQTREPVELAGYLWWFEGDGLVSYKNGTLNTKLEINGHNNTFVKNNFISTSTENKIYFSYDLGENWIEKQFYEPFNSSDPYQGYFDGGDTMYCITNYPTIIHYTHDGGDTWSSIYEPGGNYMYFFDNKNYLSVNFFEERRYFFKTNDGGLTFVNDSVEKPIKEAYILSDKIAFLYGNNGVIYKTNNAAGLLQLADLKEENEFVLWPNTLHGEELKLRLGISNFLPRRYSLLDQTGREISYEQLPLPGLKEISFNFTSLPNGLYFIRLESEKEKVTLRFVKD